MNEMFLWLAIACANSGGPQFKCMANFNECFNRETIKVAEEAPFLLEEGALDAAMELCITEMARKEKKK